jgi:hypothetical protein
MKNIIGQLVGITALFACTTASAAITVDTGVSELLRWSSPEIRLTMADLERLNPDTSNLTCELNGPFTYNCLKGFLRPSPSSVVTAMYLRGQNSGQTYILTNEVSAKFTLAGQSDGIGQTRQASLAGKISANGTITIEPPLEAWVGFGVNVEVYEINVAGVANRKLIGGTVAVSQSCATEAGIGVSAPCRIVLSDDVPISIPLLLTEFGQYEVVVTSSCVAQGPGASCHGPKFFDSNIIMETLIKDFTVTAASPVANQKSINTLIDSNKTLMREVCTLTRFRSQACRDL